MHFSGVDWALWLAGVSGEILLLLALLVRRSYGTFPIFFSWICLVLFLEPTFYWLSLHTSQNTYYRVFFALNFPQYFLEIGVLAEIALNVIRPVRKTLSRGLLIIFASGVAIIVAVGFLVAARANAVTLVDPRAFIVINTTMAILRLATFILIAGFSQLLGLNWKNHVLQLASGLAFYAVVTLIAELGHSYLRAGPNYSSNYYALEHLRVGGYLCALYFWCYAFARKEASRKEFSPQMTNFLVSISGSTKRQQAVLARTRDQ